MDWNAIFANKVNFEVLSDNLLVRGPNAKDLAIPLLFFPWIPQSLAKTDSSDISWPVFRVRKFNAARFGFSIHDQDTNHLDRGGPIG